MSRRATPQRRRPSRTQKRYLSKREAERSQARPISVVGGGQGGFLSSMGGAGSFYG